MVVYSSPLGVFLSTLVVRFWLRGGLFQIRVDCTAFHHRTRPTRYGESQPRLCNLAAQAIRSRYFRNLFWVIHEICHSGVVYNRYVHSWLASGFHFPLFRFAFKFEVSDLVCRDLCVPFGLEMF